MEEISRRRVRSGFPGMKVLEFTFDSRDTGSASDDLPLNYTENCVACTGTHDNETLNGWFKVISRKEKQMAWWDYPFHEHGVTLHCAVRDTQVKELVITVEAYCPSALGQRMH